MLTIQDVSKRFGISEKTVRRRLDSLSPVIDQHLTTGAQNAIMVKDAGLAIFDRVMQLIQQGKLSPSAAIEKVINEVQQPDTALDKQGGSAVQTFDQLVPEPTKELIDMLKQQADDLRGERDRLLGIVESQQDQIQLMLPGSISEDSMDKRGRWQHLKAALFGQ